MSKISIAGASTGTATFTLESPATSTNRTITLADATGTMVVSGTTPSLNGITFPATQVASAGANTLDDYEEGTYTPSLSWTDGIGNMTYGARVGRYTKIGNIVNVSALIEIATEGTAAGNVRITMPFVSKNVANQFTAAAFWYNTVTGSASGNDVVALLFPNDDVLRIYAVVTGTIAQFDNSMTLDGTNFAFNITYEV